MSVVGSVRCSNVFGSALSSCDLLLSLLQDERFEQLFKRYAEKAKIDVQKLVFCFDGDKIDSSSTPESLGMEDDDLIEVHVKPR